MASLTCAKEVPERFLFPSETKLPMRKPTGSYRFAEAGPETVILFSVLFHQGRRGHTLQTGLGLVESCLLKELGDGVRRYRRIDPCEILAIRSWVCQRWNFPGQEVFFESSRISSRMIPSENGEGLVMKGSLFGKNAGCNLPSRTSRCRITR